MYASMRLLRRCLLIFLLPACWVALAAAGSNPSSGITSGGSSTTGSRLAGLLVYGNPSVVNDVAVPGFLLDAIRDRILAAATSMTQLLPPLLPADSSKVSSVSKSWWQVTNNQPTSLATPPLGTTLSSAAYIIPFQGLDRRPYAAAEGIFTSNSVSLSDLRAFVRAGGNLILLGNTAQDRTLGLVEAVLQRPHRCEVATSRHLLNTAMANSSSESGLLLQSPQPLSSIYVPRGLGGGERGGVGVLRCNVSVENGGDTAAIPWVYEERLADCVTTAATASSSSSSSSSGSVVGSAFAWAAGRGRVVWIGATFDAATPDAWIRITAAAAVAPPLRTPVALQVIYTDDGMLGSAGGA